MKDAWSFLFEINASSYAFICSNVCFAISRQPFSFYDIGVLSSSQNNVVSVIFQRYKKIIDLQI